MAARKNNQSQIVNTYGGYDQTQGGIVTEHVQTQQTAGTSGLVPQMNKKLNSHANSMSKLEKK